MLVVSSSVFTDFWLLIGSAWSKEHIICPITSKRTSSGSKSKGELQVVERGDVTSWKSWSNKETKNNQRTRTKKGQKEKSYQNNENITCCQQCHFDSSLLLSCCSLSSSRPMQDVGGLRAGRIWETTATNTPRWPRTTTSLLWGPSAVGEDLHMPITFYKMKSTVDEDVPPIRKRRLGRSPPRGRHRRLWMPSRVKNISEGLRWPPPGIEPELYFEWNQQSTSHLQMD